MDSLPTVEYNDQTPYDTLKVELSVTRYQLSCIMSGALDGCTFWADDAAHVGPRRGEYLSDHVALGGAIRIHVFEDVQTGWHVLTREKILDGLAQMVRDEGHTPEWLAEQGDMYDNMRALQYMLFGEHIYD